MKTSKQFAEEKETKEFWLFYDEEDELLAIKLATAYALHVLEEVEKREELGHFECTPNFIEAIQQIRKELEG